MEAPASEHLYRGKGRIIGGVCCGIAARLRVDTLWVRIAFVALAFAQGVGLVLYAVLWILMPDAPEGEVAGRSGFHAVTADLERMWAEVRGGPAQAASGGTEARATDRSLMLGVILLVIGLVLLGNNTGFVNWSVLWPLILIAIGAFVLLRNAQRKP
ncbi:MAG TPA: PspC domain-containing protein [Candidatus Dormibacteraeota bacterium]|nr:PspC domain-containing protein [Candidatus Dormibacteraeota bacterium]